MPAFVDLTGHTYGRLTVVERAEECQINGRLRTKWVCTCECGGITVAIGHNLRTGTTKSCGCLQVESRDTPRTTAPTYGGAHSRISRERGLASEHPCVDCGGSAEQWAYDHTDQDELTWTMTGGRMKGKTVAYSADPAHYSPRCHSCHVRFDQGR